MKHLLTITALVLAMTASAASAACQAEIKAKRGSDYIHQWMSVDASSCSAASIKATLESQGYTNVRVVNIGN